MKNEKEGDLRPKQQEFCDQKMIEKYALAGETSARDIQMRVANGLGLDNAQKARFLDALESGFVPGGRVNRAIGSNTVTTAINCFVQPLGDCISGRDQNGEIGIMEALAQSAETMRRGGGVGYDFSELRPSGATVKGTGSNASGPVSYMYVFDKMCETIESAGARRGAQMGVLRVDHPDIQRFIDAKKAPDLSGMGLPDVGVRQMQQLLKSNEKFMASFRQANAKLSNFNISVAVTDEFMEAVVADGDFDLVHQVPPTIDSVVKKLCKDGVERYVYQTVKARAIWEQIMLNTYNGAEPGVIFIDTVNADNNLRYCETIKASNPCGEQFLPAYGCCDLGSINLARLVTHPFEKNAKFQWEKFKTLVADAVELLDRVLDVTNWPLQQQKVEAQSKRRIGLGFLALADAMAMLNIRYDSQQGVEFAAKVAETMRDSAYAASVALAQQLGAFPFFDADKYLEHGTFASRLPKKLQDAIRTHGIRNSHLLSIAPTGTSAICFADNASSGIEPIFSLNHIRTTLNGDGSRQSVQIMNAAYRMFCLEKGSDADTSVFSTALNMSVDDHLNVVAAVAPFIDSAISKTVNVPQNYSFEDFAHVYMRAWKSKLKGITTFRPNDAVGAVLSDADNVQSKNASSMPTDDPDRRIELKEVSGIESVMKWPNRPPTPLGNPSVTYSISHQAGDFAVQVGHYVNGKRHPLEVYVSGNEQPRCLSAIAKALSVDMRTGDAGWLRMKLESLASTEADDAFSMHDPDMGNMIRVPSLVSGFALCVTHALNAIDALQDTGKSTMVDALFSKREPKTGPMGAVEWGVDIKNDVTGDDFHMTTKEARMPDGSVRPYSIWLSGKYPRVLDGLAKILSIDMRISDPSWILMKLSKLLNYGEQRGDFLAMVPGENRQMNYPSTVAYMATLLLERYRVLGLVKTELAMAYDVATPALDIVAKEPLGVGMGMLCRSCNTMSLHRVAGCTYCQNCGAEGGCG